MFAVVQCCWCSYGSGFAGAPRQRGLLSGRSPRQLGWRMLPSLVHSVNVTSPTSRGCAQCASRACSAGTGVPNGLVAVSSGRSRRIRSVSMAWVNLVPTCPASAHRKMRTTTGPPVSSGSGFPGSRSWSGCRSASWPGPTSRSVWPSGGKPPGRAAGCSRSWTPTSPWLPSGEEVTILTPLARQLDADVLLLLTDVATVQDGYGTPQAHPIRRATPAELRARNFPAGSMGPKIEAVCLRRGRPASPPPSASWATPRPWWSAKSAPSSLRLRLQLDPGQVSYAVLTRGAARPRCRARVVPATRRGIPLFRDRTPRCSESHPSTKRTTFASRSGLPIGSVPQSGCSS